MIYGIDFGLVWVFNERPCKIRINRKGYVKQINGTK